MDPNKFPEDLNGFIGFLLHKGLYITGKIFTKNIVCTRWERYDKKITTYSYQNDSWSVPIGS